MNEFDKNPNYSNLYMILEAVFEKIGYFNYGHHDETLCSMRVYETAKDIINKINQPVKKEIILTAAVLHDIGKSELDLSIIQNENSVELRKEWDSHIKKSVPLAKQVLLKEGHSEEFSTEVCNLIGFHNKSIDGLDERSLELQILQDADIVADCGIVDFLRCFSFGGINKRPLIGSIKYLLQKTDRVHEEERLNLDVSKELVKEKMVSHNNLLKELSVLIKSDLLKSE